MSARTAASLAGTYRLVSIEEHAGQPRAARIRQPLGLLILDDAGLVFEAVSRTDRTGATEDPQALTDAQRTFATCWGFWGRYTIDADAGTMIAHAEGAVSPNVMGKDWTRRFSLDGDRLTVTTAAVEPHQKGITRWVWARVPAADDLGCDYRNVVGFWQHVVEKRVNLTLTTETATTRAPSVIVYSPSGYVGVCFPPRHAAKPFAGPEPTDAEAREALRGFVGYFGVVTAHPGYVLHHVIGGLRPHAPTTLKRFFDIGASGTLLTLRFPVVVNALDQQTTTLVTMTRLRGEHRGLAT